MRSGFTVLVNSCDAYQDCWEPFFCLFRKHWPDCDAPIVLNTESRSFVFQGLDIRCPCVSRTAGRQLGWGGRLMRTLDVVETDIVLLILDDFFILSPVQTGVVRGFVDLMASDDLTHILLSEAPGPNKPSPYPLLVARGQRAPYRLSLQVGLWNRDRLKSYLRPHESAWQTELWGSRRAWRKQDSFFCLDVEGHDRVLPVEYFDTGGIARGKWIESKVVPLFKAHGIGVNFSERGFYDPMERPTRLRRIRNRILTLPTELRSRADLWFGRT